MRNLLLKNPHAKICNPYPKAKDPEFLADSVRVFAIPGLGHCVGGSGCDSFDKLAVIDQWMETGKAPERIVASKLQNGEAVKTHPLCAWPMVAKYKGMGDPNQAENFTCAKQ